MSDAVETPDIHTLDGGLENSTIKMTVEDGAVPAPKAEKKADPKLDPYSPKDDIAALRAEIAALKRSTAPKDEPKAQVVEEAVNWEDLFFSDPAAAVKKIEERVEKKLRAEYAEVTTQSEQKVAITRFWDDFKKENPDLADEDSLALVESELTKSWDHVKDLPYGEARQILAERTRKRMLRMLKKESAGGKDQRTLTEGSPVKSSLGGGDESPKVLSLSDVIRRKQALMRKGA